MWHTYSTFVCFKSISLIISVYVRGNNASLFRNKYEKYELNKNKIRYFFAILAIFNDFSPKTSKIWLKSICGVIIRHFNVLTRLVLTFLCTLGELMPDFFEINAKKVIFYIFFVILGVLRAVGPSNFLKIRTFLLFSCYLT